MTLLRRIARIAREAVRPHLLTDHELPGLIRSLHVEDDLALVGVGSRTNLELVLAGPTTLRTSGGEHTVTRVGIWVDEPREVARLYERRRASTTRTRFTTT